jgi:hypothetical protein
MEGLVHRQVRPSRTRSGSERGLAGLTPVPSARFRIGVKRNRLDGLRSRLREPIPHADGADPVVHGFPAVDGVGKGMLDGFPSLVIQRPRGVQRTLESFAHAVIIRIHGSDGRWLADPA